MTHLPGADNKIVFDKYHITMYLNRAVDLTHRLVIRKGGRSTSGLKRTRHLWLFAGNNLDADRREQFERIRVCYVRLRIAWTNKEHFAEFWRSSTREAAQQFFDTWFESVRQTFNQPMVDAANTLRRHLGSMFSYVTMLITHAVSESINSRIQLLKCRSRGFRNATRFERSIMFY